MKVALELRPAFDGHSGIPQETRLLFRGLAQLPDVEVIGLLHSSNLVLEPGLPMRRGRLVGSVSDQEAIDRLSRVVISLQQGALSNRLEWVRSRSLKYAGPILAWAGSLLGRRISLGRFDATHFKDFIWRALFAKSLPASDFEAVTSREFRVLRWPWSVLSAAGVVSGSMGRAAYLPLDTTGLDVFIAETPYPARVRKGTKMVVRYHDAIPLLMPHTIKNRGYARAAHLHALRRNARDGAWFACVSEATRLDLLSVMPEVADRAVTIPNMIADQFYPETASAERVPDIVWSRRNRRAPMGGGVDVASSASGRFDYLLMVATIEPRKNHLALMDAWELLRSDGTPDLQLVLVGSFGWDHDAIMQRFAPWLQRGGLHLLEGVPSDDLRLLYRHASVTVCPSFGEGFDFPGVEAMRCGGVVAASRIPVHEGVFGRACEYFSPYEPADLAAALRRLTGPDAAPRRAELVAEGARVSGQYLPDRVLPQWQQFLKVIAR